MNIVKPSSTVRMLFPNSIWKIKTAEPVLFLTFDDGPIPEITTWVLDVLAKYNAKATFFCVGDNVAKHPQVYGKVLSEGHLVGNHTQNHLQGIKNRFSYYIDNIKKASTFIESDYFRPPHGLLTHRQSAYIRKELNMKVVMWDVLSVDYSPKITPEKCLQNVTGNAGAGSIIVFHDSLKAEQNLKFTLPKVLEYYSQKGYSFKTLEEES